VLQPNPEQSQPNLSQHDVVVPGGVMQAIAMSTARTELELFLNETNLRRYRSSKGLKKRGGGNSRSIWDKSDTGRSLLHAHQTQPQGQW